MNPSTTGTSGGKNIIPYLPTSLFCKTSLASDAIRKLVVAGPEGFEPSTVPRTRLVGSFFRLRASASLSLLLYLAEPPGQTLDDPAYGPRRPAKCAATRRFLLKIVTFTHWLYASGLA